MCSLFSKQIMSSFPDTMGKLYSKMCKRSNLYAHRGVDSIGFAKCCCLPGLPDRAPQSPTSPTPNQRGPNRGKDYFWLGTPGWSLILPRKPHYLGLLGWNYRGHSAKGALSGEDPARPWAGHGHGRTPMEGSPGQKELGVFSYSMTNGHGAQGTLCEAELLKLFHISVPGGRQKWTQDAWGSRSASFHWMSCCWESTKLGGRQHL